MQARWEHFEHGADIGVRGIAASRAGAFEQAALALMAVITEPGRVAGRDTVTIDCEAADDELLLVAWLNALVYEMAVRHMLFARFYVTIDGHRLHAKPGFVSEQAKRRQRDEMGTLGSGNHYLEVQEVTQVFDEGKAASYALGLGDVVVMIHCGSRGLGHQIGTEFLSRMVAAAPVLA